MCMCICKNVTEVISLCGGGIAAIMYAHGILYGLHKLGKLVVNKQGKLVLNENIVYTATSGGVVPLLILQCIINNDLQNTRDDWFEYYITRMLDKIQTYQMIALTTANTVKSFCIYSNTPSTDTVRFMNTIIDIVISQLTTAELQNGKPLYFDNNTSHFNYNYVIDSQLNDMPEVSNDFTNINNMPLSLQISEILSACCVPLTFSYLNDGILNDAGFMIDNDVLDLDRYCNLKNVYYYTLTAYDGKTNNAYKESLFSINNFNARVSRVYNYRAINNLKLYCTNRNIRGCGQIKFNLMTLPNKYNPVMKYNNKIYRELVRNIFVQNDFIPILRYIGIFNGDSRMLQFMFLLGAYETLYAMGGSEELAGTLTDTLPDVYREILDNPSSIYFKDDIVSSLNRFIASMG
jgi:hypothetical protein